MGKKNGKHLYFISDRKGHVKVGSANDVDKRLRELQTGNANDLYVAARFDDLGNMESYAHRVLKKEKQRNEWFWFGSAVLGLIKKLVGKSANHILHGNIKSKIDKNETLPSKPEMTLDELYRDDI